MIRTSGVICADRQRVGGHRLLQLVDVGGADLAGGADIVSGETSTRAVMVTGEAAAGDVELEIVDAGVDRALGEHGAATSLVGRRRCLFSARLRTLQQSGCSRACSATFGVSVSVGRDEATAMSPRPRSGRT